MSRDKKIAVDSLLYNMFYDMYNVYRDLVDNPPYKGGASSTQLVNLDEVKEKLEEVDALLGVWEKQTKIEQYTAPYILASESRVNGLSKSFGMSLYRDYLDVKYWQSLLQARFAENQVKAVDTCKHGVLPFDWITQVTDIVKAACVNKPAEQTIDWSYVFDRLESFRRVCQLHVADAPHRPVKDNPQA